MRNHKMKSIQSRHNHYQLRHFATKYTARVTSKTKDGRLLAVEVRPTLPTDTRGHPIPRRALICKIAQVLQSPKSSNPFDDLTHYLENLNINLTSFEATFVLKSLSSPLLSLQFYNFCPSHFPNFRHDSYFCNRILLILSKEADFGGFEWVERVNSIVDEMENNGVRGNISTINILVRALGAKGIEKCLGLVKKWDLQMNSYTYKCIMQSYLRSYDVDTAFQVYGDMKKKGHKLDVIGYNMLLDALAKNDKVDLACKVFQDMKKMHCQPDEFTYTIMVRMMGKVGKPDEALVFFQEMLSNGFSPNLIGYNTMIQALVLVRRVDKALFLFSKMIEKDCPPNEFTYSLILNVLAATGQLEKLEEVMQISKKYMTKSVYAYLVRTLSKLGHGGEAHRLFCNMWTLHDQGDKDVCMSMLESFCSAGKTSEALDLLDKIHEKGISSDTLMYNVVLSALGRLKQISHLHDLYERMKKDGPSPNIFSYNILISSFGRAGEVDEAVKIFDELEESPCKPDIISYNSLINCLGKNGDLDEAHMRFKEMQEKGLNPDVFTYSTLIECFGKSGKVEMACRLFDEMIAQGCAPNIVTYNILLDCLEKSGKTAEAVDLYAKLKQQGLTPDSITYAVLERLQSGSHRAVRIRKKNPITGWVVSPLR